MDLLPQIGLPFPIPGSNPSYGHEKMGLQRLDTVFTTAKRRSPRFQLRTGTWKRPGCCKLT